MKEKVREGYEAGDYEGEYRNNREIREHEKEIFQKLFNRIPEDASILDLGCGTGEPFDRYLADQGYDVKGVDLVEKHVHAAREYVPEADFIQGDFFDVDPENERYDAVVSFYAVFHIPREKHLELLQHIHNLTSENGAVLLTMGGSEMDEHTEEDWSGSEMVWSSYSPEKNIELVEEAGFEVVESYRETDYEGHLWVLAERN